MFGTMLRANTAYKTLIIYVSEFHVSFKSVFPMCLALVEVFGDFRRQIRIQHVELL